MSMLLTFILWFLMGGITAYFAFQRGRDPFIWFVLGILLGVLALLVLFFLADLSAKAPGDTSTSIPQQQQTFFGLEAPQDPPQELKEQAFLTKEWFCIDRTFRQLGPMDFETLKSLWIKSDIDENSFVWAEEMPEWKKIIDLSDVYHALNVRPLA